MSLRRRICQLLCGLLAAGSILLALLALLDARQSIREEITAGTRVTTQILHAWIARGQAGPEELQGFLSDLGRVRANEIRMVRDGRTVYVSPPSAYKAGRWAPEWFGWLVTPQLESVSLRVGAARLDIIPDASRAVLDAWDDLLLSLLLPVLWLLAAVLLVFWRLGRDLAPVAHIEAALAQVQNGQRQVRLPHFGLAELDRIGSGFNRMVERLLRSERDARDLEREAYAESVARAQLEQARREWSRELHDELGQNLTAIGALARAIANGAAPDSNAAAAATSIQQTAGQVHDDLRRMLGRMRHEEAGIEVALARLLETWRACHPQVDCQLECDGRFDDLPQARRIALFRVTQEALTNVARHARALNLKISLARDGAWTRLEVADDGQGFDPSRPAASNRYGLSGMVERLTECGGRLLVHSAPGAGTRISAAVPC